MIRKMILAGTAVLLAAAATGVVYAQQPASDSATTKTGFSYELKGNQRVEKPDSRTVAADGTIREEYRSGKCVTIKEKRPDGAVKTTRKCD